MIIIVGTRGDDDCYTWRVLTPSEIAIESMLTEYDWAWTMEGGIQDERDNG
ncbi:MAG: hypothetical protein JRC60_06340 [Deltaproteobacteria bacterium]|nr:hypothetical protein [Deltaproteobacteria bacterium]